MNNFSMSKKEVLVLFDLLKLSELPCSIRNMPAVSAKDYAGIAKKFYDSCAISSDGGRMKVDKGLELFLAPLKLSNRVLLFNYGEDGKCLLNLSVYFSGKGTVAVRENSDRSKIDFIRIDSFDELSLLLPAVEDVSSQSITYISYWLFEKDIGTVHCAVIDPAKNIVNIVESKRKSGDSRVNESKTTVDIFHYADLYKNKLKEIYNVSDS